VLAHAELRSNLSVAKAGGDERYELELA